MSEEDYRKIFVERLNYYMKKYNKNQMDLMVDLNLSSSTVSSWCTGAKLPRMGKIQMLADYFGIEKSDLLEHKKNGTNFIELSNTEKQIIEAYRAADNLTQAMVLRSLGLDTSLSEAEDGAEEKLA